MLDTRLIFIMLGSRLLSIGAVFIACVYCGKDFQSLGRHSWRCKKKLNNTSKPNEPEKTALQLDSEPVSGYNIVKHVCGKECKGMKGLKCTKGVAELWIIRNFLNRHDLNIYILTPAKQVSNDSKRK